MPSSVFVTGADGFIGSHLVEALVRRGRHVRALVLYNALGRHGWLEQLQPEIAESTEIVMGDIRDHENIRQAMRGCDSVAHLAALIGIPYSYHAAQSYVETNISGTLNVLHAARDLGVRRLVQTSTSEVYGAARSVPITEEHRLHAQSPYAATKIAADQLALSFHASFGVPVIVLRPFNAYGPRQSARAIIPTIISQIASGSREIKLGALHPTRDFSYVADTVAAFCAALDCEHYGEVINVGGGFEIAIGDLAQTIADIMGVPVDITIDPERLRPQGSEVTRLWAANDKAQKLLGWQPEYAGRDGLRKGLEHTIAWFLDPANLAGYRNNRYTL